MLEIEDGKLLGDSLAFDEAVDIWPGAPVLAARGNNADAKAILQKAKAGLPRWRTEWDLADRELARLG